MRRLRDAAGRFVRKPRRANSDLRGVAFGQLKVIRFAGYINIKGGTRRLWKCRCRCGQYVIVSTNQLTTGNTRSCGCLKLAIVITRNRKRATHHHNGLNSPTYRSWQAMRQRCRNSNDPSFGNYGGAGVSIARRWDSFVTFLNDLGPRPAGTTIGRIRDTGDYRPGNARWMTRAEQEAEKRLKAFLRRPAQAAA